MMNQLTFYHHDAYNLPILSLLQLLESRSDSREGKRAIGYVRSLRKLIIIVNGAMRRPTRPNSMEEEALKIAIKRRAYVQRKFITIERGCLSWPDK